MKNFKRFIAVVLVVAMMCTFFHIATTTSAAYKTGGYASYGNIVAYLDSDGATGTVPADFGTSKDADGRVWTDKTVKTDLTNGCFNVTLSALSQEYITTSASGGDVKQTAADVLMILDVTGSMKNSLTSNSQPTKLSDTRFSALVDAVNIAIQTVVAANKNNRIMISVYGGETVTTLFPLAKYSTTATSGKYLQLTGTVSSPKIETVSGVKKDGNTFSANVGSYSKTYPQIGIYKATKEFINAAGTTQFPGKRVPYVLFMTDGNFNGASEDCFSSKDSDYTMSNSDATGTDAAAYIILTAANQKDKILTKYNSLNAERNKITDVPWFNIGIAVDVPKNAGSADNLQIMLNPSLAVSTSGNTTSSKKIYNKINSVATGDYAKFKASAGGHLYAKDNIYFAGTESASAAREKINLAFVDLAELVAAETAAIILPITYTNSAAQDQIFITFHDTLGEGMEFKKDGKFVLSTVHGNLEGVKQLDGKTYKFSYIDDEKKTVTMKSTVVVDGNGLDWYIDANELPIIRFKDRKNPNSVTDGAERYEGILDPIRLTYQVSPTADALKDGKAHYQTKYDSSKPSETIAYFTPSLDNTYYYSVSEGSNTGRVDHALSDDAYEYTKKSKTDNLTATHPYSLSGEWNGDYVKDTPTKYIAYLGNNGVAKASANVTKTVSKEKAGAGETLTYTIKVNNLTGTAQTGCTVTDALPTGMTYVSSTPTASVSGNTLTWNTTLAAGENVFTVKASINTGVTVGTKLENVAGISKFAGQALSTSATNTATVEVVPRYNVTFEENGGTAVDDQKVTKDEYAVKPVTDPTKTGYVFDDWYADSDFKNKFDFAGTPIVKDTTIYAKWKPATDTKYKVEHYLMNTDGKTYPNTPKDTDNLTGTTGEQTDAKSKTYTGFTLVGNVQNTAIAADGSTVVKLYYSRNAYKVTFEENGGSTVADKTGVLYDTKITAPTDPTKTGYDFKGWYTDEGLQNKFDFANTSIVKDTTLYAKWIPATDTKYKVEHYLMNTDGTTYPKTPKDTDNLTGATGEQTDAKSKTYTGFTLVGNVQNTAIAADGSTVVKLYYSRNAYKVTFEENGGSTVADKTGVLYDTKITAPADPTKTGYDFKGWYTDEGLQNKFDFANTSIVKDTTLYAKWTPVAKKIYFDRPEEGKLPVPTNSNTLYDNKIKVVPNGGSWTHGGSTYTSSTELTVDGDITLEKPTRTKYVFMGWEETAGTGDVQYVYTAKWLADDNEDNIPDIYQIEVTYKVVNGTWSNDSITPKTELVTLMKDNKWSEDGSATATAPTGMKNIVSYTDHGAWDVTPNLGKYTITKTSQKVFTYTFDTMKSYIVRVSVTNGTSDASAENTVYYGGNKVISFSANKGYVLDSVKVDGADAALTLDKYAFENVTADHTIAVVYEIDTNDDGVADKYQKFITFKIVNGKWSDDSDKDELIVLTLYDEGGKLSETGKATLEIPEGMKANEGFTGGKWDVDPSVEVLGAGKLTYVYEYVEEPKTSDNFNICLWLAAMAASLAGAVVLMVNDRKKKSF